ncbi:MAG: hypothetical protein ACKN9U_23630, partial [Pirellulaceae bacterium]
MRREESTAAVCGQQWNVLNVLFFHEERILASSRNTSIATLISTCAKENVQGGPSSKSLVLHCSHLT